MTNRDSERCALVTGAGSGIGQATAVRLANEGIHVILHYHRSEQGIAETAARCERSQVRAVPVKADLRSTEQIAEMKEQIRLTGLTPDILVNNAGVSHFGLIQDVSEQDFDQVVAANLKAMFFCTQAFIPNMLQKDNGRIVNISSIWGLSGASCEVLYSLTKSGVHGFTKALAKELAPHQITVNAVAPGMVDTVMMRGFSDDERDDLKEQIPMGRFADPEEIASVVSFLSNADAAYITGQIISPNGGFLT